MLLPSSRTVRIPIATVFADQHLFLRSLGLKQRVERVFDDFSPEMSRFSSNLTEPTFVRQGTAVINYSNGDVTFYLYKRESAQVSHLDTKLNTVQVCKFLVTRTTAQMPRGLSAFGSPIYGHSRRFRSLRSAQLTGDALSQKGLRTPSQ